MCPTQTFCFGWTTPPPANELGEFLSIFYFCVRGNNGFYKVANKTCKNAGFEKVLISVGKETWVTLYWQQPTIMSI